ncbi:methyltransferase domain-containing protein [Candidatus Kaiserbacteria bacterium]|nr:methyltransferase domain-containing protein [Candidatus Kaiserbacteria bacterium]
MNDALGSKLQEKRKNVVMPNITGSYLDIGCGYNNIAREYKEKNPEEKSLGVDVYPWKGCDHVVEDTAALPYDDTSFNTVSCVAALNHIPYREKVVAEMYRILKPGGTAIITMIPPGLSKIWHKIREPWDEDQHERGMIEGEVFGLTKKEIVDMFEKEGFKVKKIQGFMLGINKLYIFEK